MLTHRPIVAIHPPFIHCGASPSERYWNLFIACLPATLFGLLKYSPFALGVVTLSVSSAMGWEWLFSLATKRPMRLSDGSSALMGMLFGMLLPATAPWWLVILGTFLAVVVGRQIYGGLGCNPVNPVLLSFAIVYLSWRSVLDFTGAYANFNVGFYPVDPLNAAKFGGLKAAKEFSYLGLLLGDHFGGIGTTFNLGLIVGGVYVALRGFIKWEISLMYLVSVFITSWIFNLADPNKYVDPIFHLLAGYTMIGAFFLVTEDSSSPVNLIPKLVYGAIAGVMTVLIRNIGGYPEGVVFAILLSNVFHPILDKIRPKAFGKGG